MYISIKGRHAEGRGKVPMGLNSDPLPLLTVFQINPIPRGGGGESYFPYTLLNEIHTMFSQLAKRQQGSCQRICVLIMRRHYVKNHRSTVLRKNKNMAVEGGTVSHYYILVIRKFIDFMSLFRHSVWFSLSVKQFPFAEFSCKPWES